MFWDSTLLLLVPVMIFAMWAQHRVKSTYREFLAVPAARGLTGREAARRLLDAAGLHDVGIETVAQVLQCRTQAGVAQIRGVDVDEQSAQRTHRLAGAVGRSRQLPLDSRVLSAVGKS